MTYTVDQYILRALDFLNAVDNQGGLHAKETFKPGPTLVSKAVRTRNFKYSLKLEFEEIPERKVEKEAQEDEAPVALYPTPDHCGNATYETADVQAE